MNQHLLKAAIPLVALLTASCVQTTEMPLAPNVVRLETTGGGLIGRSEVPKQTMRKAAELTLEKGYSHFKFADPSVNSRSEIAGYPPGMTTTRATVIGNTGFATTTSSPGFLVRQRRTDIGVTVVMFHANDPGARGAFDAKAVLKAYGGEYQ
jgi:hypothetical protein